MFRLQCDHYIHYNQDFHDCDFVVTMMAAYIPRNMIRRLLNAQHTPYICPGCLHGRSFTTSPPTFSGHSKWATIKHDKARNDGRKNAVRNIIAKDIANASRAAGPDPKTNNYLANAITSAKKAGMSKDSIEAGIQRGQGRSLNGDTLEAMTIEAVVPPASMILNVETDNKARALQELRTILKAHGGVNSPTAYLFERRGRLIYNESGDRFDDIMVAALEADALDVQAEEEAVVVVDTEASKLSQVEEAIAKALSLRANSSETIWAPNADTLVTEADNVKTLEKLHEALSDYPGIQGVYSNLQMS